MFGGLAVDPDATGASPSIGPRRFALLAIVAAAGARGITREKVIGILWPDNDEEQARHTLSQTLYLLRREAGAAWITGGAHLRLDPACTSDVWQFQEALGAGHTARAARLATGPFLDGFYLDEAPAFEQWVEDTRARLRADLRKALESLAREASDAGAFSEAADWWQRLIDLDPFSATHAAGRIRALIAAGDRMAALTVAQEYEARVRYQLEEEPDPSIGQLVAALRVTPSPREHAESLAAHVGVTSATAAGSALDAVLDAPPETSALPIRERTGIAEVSAVDAAPAIRWRQHPLAVAALASMVVLAGIVWQLRSAAGAATNTLPVVAVGVIESRDRASSGTVLRELLATNLGRLQGLRVVAQSRLLELLPAGDSVTPVAATAAARRAGADEIIEGGLEVAGTGLVLTLRRVSLERGVVLQGYTIRASDLLALTDSVTSAVATDFGLDPLPATGTAARTRSSVALALYEQGLRAFHLGRYSDAAQLMYAALGRDSAFAMAAAYAWRANVDMNRYDVAQRDLPIVRRLAAQASERERLVIETMIARYGKFPLAEYLTLARQLTERYPEDPDGHVLLGEAEGFDGDWLNAIRSFNRAIAIDSAAATGSSVYCRLCIALLHLRDAYLWIDSAAAAERTARRLIALRPREALGRSALIVPLLRQGRRSEAEAANAMAARLAGSNEVDYHSLNRDLISTGRLEELEQRIIAELRTAPPELVGELPWLLAIVLRNQGRLHEARELMSVGSVPGANLTLTGHTYPVMAAIVALEAGAALEAARVFLQLSNRLRARVDGPGEVARDVSWHLTLAATAFAAAGDTAMVRALADSVHRIGRQSSIARDYRLHHFLHGLLLARENRHAEAVEAFRRSIYSLTDGYTRTNLELARSLTALERYSEAVAVLQPALRGGVDGMNTYVTHTELHEALAHAFHGAGRHDSARVHYAAVERAWRRADQQFSMRYQTARERAGPPK